MLFIERRVNFIKVSDASLVDQEGIKQRDLQASVKFCRYFSASTIRRLAADRVHYDHESDIQDEPCMCSVYDCITHGRSQEQDYDQPKLKMTKASVPVVDFDSTPFEFHSTRFDCRSTD